MSLPISASTQRWLRLTGWGCLLALFAFSFYLGLTRIYQVDEAQNLFMARILASHWEGSHYLGMEIWHLWPMGWLAGHSSDAVGLFHAGRTLMVALMWLSILLTALSCGLSWRARPFLCILLGAATLAPLWDYGFEVRHDNLLLPFLLLFLLALRRPTRHFRARAAVLGALGGLMVLVIVKSPFYWLPLALLFLLQPPESWTLSRSRTLLFGALGFLGTLGLAGLLLKATGHLAAWEEALSATFRMAAGDSVGASAWPSFVRLTFQTPLLVSLAVAALFTALGSCRSDWQRRTIWSGHLPETLLLLLGCLGMLLHPMPLPYHLCLIVPFAFILGIRWLLALPPSLLGERSLRAFGVTLVLFTHAIPFLNATSRHLDFTNERQERLMILAESLTDPSDRVFDAAGLVASRPSIGQYWFLHTFLLERYRKGAIPSVRRMLQEHPAPVVIPNYRFAWLLPEDVAFLKAHYLFLSNDFLVLGQILPAPGGTFECLHPGRYAISSRPTGAGPAPDHVLLDGARVPVPSVQVLSPGSHALRAETPAETVVGWVGPHLRQLPDLSQSDSNRLFVNWY